MDNFTEKTIQWRGGNRTLSTTDIRIYKNEDKFLIVAIERNYNEGQSVTNGAEYLWNFVLAELGANIEDCIFVESYPYEDVTYDQVFIKHNKVRWEHISNFDEFLKDFMYVPNKSRIESIQ